MNAHIDTPMEMKHEDVLRVKLEVLRREHRDLDEAILALTGAGHADQLRIVRLKKQKLALKDQIARVEDMLTPDIIA
ncbi:YdcH family protein [Paenirhodobacter sp.]|uniref:YdcH family protein n=1 Tax=Paenirhodobacter sp. TaxID=1965326 RepID=UPI003B3C06BD